MLCRVTRANHSEITCKCQPGHRACSLSQHTHHRQTKHSSRIPLGSRAHHFPRTENQRSCSWLSYSHDDRSEPLKWRESSVKGVNGREQGQLPLCRESVWRRRAAVLSPTADYLCYIRRSYQ